MGVSGGPNMIEDGLILALDASDRNSYVSGSTTWFDISGNGITGAFTGSSGVTGPTFDPQFGGGLRSNSNAGSNMGAVQLSSDPFRFGTGPYTIEVMCSISASNGSGYQPILSADNMLTGFSGNYANLFIRGAFNTIVFYPGGGSIIFEYPFTINQPIHIILSKTGNTLSSYVNGALFQTTTNSVCNLTETDGTVVIGGRLLPTLISQQYYKGCIYIVRAYNRNLSASEALQNYNALKSRFNL